MSGEAQWTDHGHIREDWSPKLDEFLDATGKRLAVFSGTWALEERSIAMSEIRGKLATEIVHNMFQFVERHGAQGGKHAEGESRSGTEDGSAESGGPSHQS